MTDLTMMHKPSQLISKSFVSNEYNLYLHGEISHNADDYLEHFAVYHQAGPEDIIRLWIQSPGGSLAVGNEYIRHMGQCGAPIIAVIGMDCASQATAIALAASAWEVDEMSTFLIHGFSYGAFGHEAQVYNQATFNKKLNEKWVRSTYTGFLDEDQILDALKGVDLLFDAEELMERLDSFKEYRESQPCPCGSPECESNQDQGEEKGFSLEDMMSDIATKAVDQAMKKLKASYDITPKVAKPKATKKVVDKGVEEA